MESNVPTAAEYRDSLRKLRILVVGAGAIGQVYAHHLMQGKAEVSFFVRPQYAEAAREGFDLHQYGLAGVRPRQHLKVFDVYTDHRRLRTLSFDQVWLCVSSPALRSGLLDDLAGSIRDALWVSFQPGLEDREYLIQRVPANKLVTGVVNFVAYQAPLPGEDLWPEGIAYFVPPMTMTTFSGPEPFVTAVANLLQSVGFTAGVRPDATMTSRFGSAVLVPFVLALEAAGWSWAKLAGNLALQALMTESIRDLHTALAKATGASAGSFALAQKPWVWKMALFAAPKLASFPIEAYFEYHFSKVRAQTDQMADDFVQLCRDNALISRPFEALRDQWRARRPKLAAPEVIQQPHREEEPTPPPTAVAPGIPVSEATTDETPHLVPVLPAPVVAAIEVDFDFDGAEEPSQPDELELEQPGVELAAAESEPTPPLQDVETADLDREPEEQVELDEPMDLEPIELEVEPLPEVKKRPAPVLRTQADLAANPDGELPKPANLLPFEHDGDDDQLEMMSSVPVDAEPLPELPAASPVAPTRPIVKLPKPAEKSGEVHFREGVGEDDKAELKRQDFIQTQLANEEADPSLRDLRAKLRSRLGASIKPPGASDT